MLDDALKQRLTKSETELLVTDGRVNVATSSKLKSVDDLIDAPLESLVLAQTKVTSIAPEIIARLKHINVVATKLAGSLETELESQNSTNSIFGTSRNDWPELPGELD